LRGALRVDPEAESSVRSPLVVPVAATTRDESAAVFQAVLQLRRRPCAGFLALSAAGVRSSAGAGCSKVVSGGAWSGRGARRPGCVGLRTPPSRCRCCADDVMGPVGLTAAASAPTRGRRAARSNPPTAASQGVCGERQHHSVGYWQGRNVYHAGYMERTPTYETDNDALLSTLRTSHRHKMGAGGLRLARRRDSVGHGHGKQRLALLPDLVKVQVGNHVVRLGGAHTPQRSKKMCKLASHAVGARAQPRRDGPCGSRGTSRRWSGSQSSRSPGSRPPRRSGSLWRCAPTRRTAQVISNFCPHLSLVPAVCALSYRSSRTS